MHLRQQQRIGIFPQMQHMIRLLHLSSIDLLQDIHQAMDECIFLEAKDEVWYERWSAAFSEGYDIESIPAGETLHEYLTQQLQMLSLSQAECWAAELLIDGIDEKGYLQISLSEVIALLFKWYHVTFSVDDVLAVLKKIQSLDPCGVGARTYQECLQLQLEHADAPCAIKRDAARLLEEDLSILAGKNLHLFKKKTGMSLQRIRTAQKIIQRFWLYPSLVRYAGRGSVSKVCIPDVILEKKEGRWLVSLNGSVSPVLRLNKEYLNLFNQYNIKQHNKECWRSHIRMSKVYIKGIQNRYRTLLKIMKQVLVKQYEFLENGEEYMQALSIKEVADALDMHSSTISRAVQHKYVQTPRGVFSMSYFFSSIGHKKSNLSQIALKAHIKGIFQNEPMMYPLCDREVQRQLACKGIKVSRRTIAKYRNDLGIASSRYRKRDPVRNH